ncbi:MAG: OmpA family protein [Bacteroidales bacterium]|nr:OmpA family protein [Bacteroidales bacterium]
MRILITGFVVFLIWSLFSVWLYVARLQPAMQGAVTVQTIPQPEAEIAEPPAPPVEVMPGELMVSFDFDQSVFTSDQQTDSRIAEYKEWTGKHSGSVIVVTGHTDNIGTREYNQQLGLRRARTVQQYLASKGIPAGQITIVSEGESRPVADNATSEGRAGNRRAEISIKK